MLINLKKEIVCFLLFILFGQVYSGQRVFIYFEDKGPLEKQNIQLQQNWIENNLTPKALKRRALRTDFPNFSYADYPIYQPYIDSLEEAGIKIIHRLRWFNAVSVNIDDQQREQLPRFSFVKKTEQVKTLVRQNISPEKPRSFIEKNGDNILHRYIEFVDATALKEKGLTGNGVLVGVFDSGFELSIPSMRHIKNNLVDAYDFVDRDSIVSNESGENISTSQHGTQTSSIIGGFFDTTDVYYEGMAPGVTFLLYKTENIDSETHLEEDNWVAAAERAELLGVDIVNTSVGYSTFDYGEGDYAYEDMNGQRAIITRAANYLTERGVVVVTSAGNEGTIPWHYITAPADGFDVIAVGSVNLSGYVTASSSYGPTIDGRLKPEVVAPGRSVPVLDNSGSVSYVNGTSFASPIVAGGLALILEQYNDLSVYEIRKELIKSCELGLLANSPDAPDNHHGYGVPQFNRMFTDSIPPDSGSKQLKIFPNPLISGRLNVEFSFYPSEKSIMEIYNCLGQIVFSKKLNSQQIIFRIYENTFKTWPSGIYFLTVKTGGKRFSKKLIRIK